MALCNFRLEVRDRHHVTQFTCELPGGHKPELGHRSVLLAPGYEKAYSVEIRDDPTAPDDPGESPLRRRETADVIVVWR